MERTPNTACIICQKLIYRRPGVLKQNNGKAYCSQTCYGISCRQEIPCSVCKTPILSGANKQTCSRSCANKTRIGTQYKTRRPSKDKVVTSRILKTRLIKERGSKCERCQYAVYEILQIHHRDRNRDNNSLQNLELLCPNCHAREHYMKK